MRRTIGLDGEWQRRDPDEAWRWSDALASTRPDWRDVDPAERRLPLSGLNVPDRILAGG